MKRKRRSEQKRYYEVKINNGKENRVLKIHCTAKEKDEQVKQWFLNSEGWALGWIK